MTDQTTTTRRCWMLVTDTLCQGTTPSVWGDDNRPVLYATEAEAVAEATDFWADHNTSLTQDIEFLIAGIDPDLTPAERAEEVRQIIDDHQFDDEPMDWAIEVDVAEDGTITEVDGDRRWTAADLHTLRN